MVMVTFEIKITVFTCLLTSDGCDSFPKHLGLAPATGKTNKGVQTQWTTQYHDKILAHIHLLSGVQTIHILIDVLAIVDRKRGCEGVDSCLTLSILLMDRKLD